MASTSSLQLDALQKLQLRSYLLALPFAAFARCMGDLLTALGYQDVHLAGRTQWKGRNREGGFDIEAIVPFGLGHHKVIAQVKQFAPDQRVYQRTVDELRGVALREWAGEALLLTTGLFSNVLHESTTSPSTTIPVQLVDGERLLQALASQRVGVEEIDGKLRVDAVYFDRLVQQHQALRRGDRRGNTKNKKEAQRQAQTATGTVTVTLTLPLSVSHFSTRL